MQRRGFPWVFGCAAFNLETSASSSFKGEFCALSCSSSYAVISGDTPAAGVVVWIRYRLWNEDV